MCVCTGVKRSRRTNAPKGFHKDDKDEAECAICHLYLHVSGLECDCCPGRRVCMHHADNLCECDPSRWRLVYRYSLQDLDGILKRVSAHLPQECMPCSTTHKAALCITFHLHILFHATFTAAQPVYVMLCKHFVTMASHLVASTYVMPVPRGHYSGMLCSCQACSKQPVCADHDFHHHMHILCAHT